MPKDQKKKKKHSFLPKLHHSATRCGYFVLILVFLLWFCLKSYFFHRLQIFLFENQPFPLKFVDQLVLSSIFTISLNVCKVNPRNYELPANPIKLILIQILILNQEINFSGFILFFWIQFLMFFLFLGLWFSFFVQIFFSFLL